MSQNDFEKNHLKSEKITINEEPSFFDVNIRTQYTFCVDDNTLNCVLNFNIQDPIEQVSITGYLQTKLSNKSDCNFVRMVVGPPEKEDPISNCRLEDILESLGIKFEKTPVYQVTVDASFGTPGVLRSFYGALFCKKDIDVQAMYLGEAIICPNITTFIDAEGDACEIVRLLRDREVNQCPLLCDNCSEDKCR
ncbi:hypothetical protein [Chengkuizengella marina]|uniref:Uncharacterized protein n=1 Tax=Chengkuizengella marina TaxID=2507566 RepID=A0A6N9Q8Y6_9BACL|nr:hypothetical protein [Chengkuizengella marina]NBI31093.1 hypothetical protein [Chengkuizengella marina]